MPNIPTSIMNKGILTARGLTQPSATACLTGHSCATKLINCTCHLRHQLCSKISNTENAKRADVSNLVLINLDVSSQATSLPYYSRRNLSALQGLCLWQREHRSRIVPWEFLSASHTIFLELKWRISRAPATCHCPQELVGRRLRQSPPVRSPKGPCGQRYKVARYHPVTERCRLGSVQTNGTVN